MNTGLQSVYLPNLYYYFQSMEAYTSGPAAITVNFKIIIQFVNKDTKDDLL
jgi:hypothetical protein